MQVPALSGETLDALVWRTLGSTAGITEQALALNPGLAAAGTLLTGGQLITLPDIAETDAPTLETVNLWD